MSIIETEIAKREDALAKHNGNVLLLEDAKNEVARLEQLVAGFDEKVLIAEIEELKTYLPHEEEVVAETEGE